MAEQDKCSLLSISTLPAVVGSNLTWKWVKFHVETSGSLTHILMPSQLQQNITVIKPAVSIPKVTT